MGYTYSSALLSEYAPLCRSALLDVDEVEAAEEGVVVVVAVAVAAIVAAAAAVAVVNFLLFTTSALVALRSVLLDELELLTAVAFCFLERAVVSDDVVVVCCC